MISVQQKDFNVGDEYHALIQDARSEGAVVTFVGLVRDVNQGNSVKELTLEHYPGMTEKSLKSIVQQAKQRWDLGKVRVIHRVGQLALSDQIVFVGVTSRHREVAFEACQFIMDYLKNQAPFWKKESTEQGDKWVDFNDKDQQAMLRWQE
ncbi:molybdopterin synthase catalytic subunit MoaE [Thalassotalea piscium]|uniref:Molybdopterin synthase catalytic subunit n=1 Tax=Thalassotalea piscium TaxID=1230533 RepID=A0A7X0NJ97_9GAMM|nr:molybdopterin synthase catalytic subunit MoaE [Thalassotalea piscium]MBB6544482.1 molybdopterin synthase catalytic subunit [Thalassotalea piscium]